MKSNIVIGWMLAVLCLLLAQASSAQSAREVRKQAEASMLVVGSVDIEPDGSVSAHVLDDADKLPVQVRNLVQRAVPQLRFEPVLVDGKAVPARARMSLRIVARPAADGTGVIAIGGAHFGEVDLESTEVVRTLGTMKPPRFPMNAAQEGGQGTVYVMLKIGRDGTVMDAVVEQVNLRVIGSEREMARFRRLFSNVVLDTVRDWTFQPPTTGPFVDAPYWSARVPVDFTLGDALKPATATPYGTWQGYVPGPRQRAPWITEEDQQGDADAVASGSLYPAHSRFKLLTPLGG